MLLTGTPSVTGSYGQAYPGSHAVHEVELGHAYVPAAHFNGNTFAVGHLYPAGQVVQAEDPISELFAKLYDPAGQYLHSEIEDAPK